MSKKNSKFIEIGHALGRKEMKKVMAGSGNIYCNVGGQQIPCYDGYNLEECTDGCIDLAQEENTYCAGCAQFP